VDNKGWVGAIVLKEPAVASQQIALQLCCSIILM